MPQLSAKESSHYVKIIIKKKLPSGNLNHMVRSYWCIPAVFMIYFSKTCVCLSDGSVIRFLIRLFFVSSLLQILISLSSYFCYGYRLLMDLKPLSRAGTSMQSNLWGSSSLEIFELWFFVTAWIIHQLPLCKSCYRNIIVAVYNESEDSHGKRPRRQRLFMCV